MAVVHKRGERQPLAPTSGCLGANHRALVFFGLCFIMLLEWGYNIQLDSSEAGSKLFCGVQGACFGLCAVQLFGFGARLGGVLSGSA